MGKEAELCLFCIEVEMSLLFQVHCTVRYNLKSIRVKMIARVGQVDDIV